MTKHYFFCTLFLFACMLATMPVLGQTNSSVEDEKNMVFTNYLLGDYEYIGPIGQDGLPDGVGYAKFLKEGIPDGREYHGPFKDGEFGGDEQAVMRMSNGDTFIGTFTNNYFDKGTYTIKATGDYFKGVFKDGIPFKGTLYNIKRKKLVEVDNSKKEDFKDEDRSRLFEEMQKYG